MSDNSSLIGLEEDTGSVRFRAAELDRHIGQRLRFVRRLSGWSQRELGSRIGMTFQQVQKYENGANRVSAALLVELAGLFHLPLTWFVGPYGDTAEPPGPQTRTFADLLEILFLNDGSADDGARSACLSTVCQLMRVEPARAERLDALRLALAAATPADAAFMLEAARRIGEQATVTPAPAPAGTILAGHVLLVDDDPDIIATLSTSLSAAGFVVNTAPGGDQALSMLGSGLRVDVLVTDYAMFGMDGVELLAQAAQIRPNLPGLVVTGFADSERLNELPPGVEVLRKPFRRMELVGRLRLLLARTHAVHAPSMATSA